MMNKRLLIIAACLASLVACNPRPDDKAQAPVGAAASARLPASGTASASASASASVTETATVTLPVAAPASAAVASATATTPAPSVITEEKVLNVYNWPDYIANDMIADFEKASGITVNYQTFGSNEALHDQLVADNASYDIVMPGAVFAKEQIDAGLLQKLDKTKIPNLTNLDSDIMAKLAVVDPDNAHLIPWAWSFTTVGIHKAKVAKALGRTPMPDNAWDLVFNPIYTAKLKSCGIAYLDSAHDVLPAALHYIGKSAYSPHAADHNAAAEMLAKVRKDLRMFSNTLIDDLAGGKVCVVLGWAGDISLASRRASADKNGQQIEALMPKSGGLMLIDSLAVPRAAKHPNNAMAFINYFLKPQVSAKLTNELGYPTANKAAAAKLFATMASDKTVVLNPAALQTLVPPAALSHQARQSWSATYAAFKQGK